MKIFNNKLIVGSYQNVPIYTILKKLIVSMKLLKTFKDRITVIYEQIYIFICVY